MINYFKGMGQHRWAGYGQSRKTIFSGPAGSSGWGNQGRKKSLGLAALAGTLGINPKGIAQGTIAPTAADRTSLIEQGMAAKVSEVKEAAPLPPGRKRIIPVPYGTPASIGKPIGMGTKPPVTISFNKKNPNQREIKSVGGSIR